MRLLKFSYNKIDRVNIITQWSKVRSQDIVMYRGLNTQLTVSAGGNTRKRYCFHKDEVVYSFTKSLTNYVNNQREL